jgi:hypothetical protein
MVFAWLMGVLGWPMMLLATQVLEDVTPDAITGATGYSPRTGDLAVLVDGEYPGGTDAAGAFTWLMGGTLTFAFEQIVKVQEVRLYVGKYVSDYVLTVQGLDLSAAPGDREEALTRAVADSSGRVDGWVVLRLREPCATRFLRLSSPSRASLYEVQIWGVRAVRPISLGLLKARFAGEPCQ